MALRRGELLTLNGVMITGILILLTVSDVGSNVKFLPQEGIAIAVARLLVTITILPFSLSCIIELNKEKDIHKNQNCMYSGILLTKIGFGYIVAVLLIAYVISALSYAEIIDLSQISNAVTKG